MNSKAISRHYLALDGLRGVAALIVVVFHRRWWLGFDQNWHGYLAVDFFYVLSGFVIAHAYGRRLANGDLSFANFFQIRIIRLYPLICLGALLGVVELFGEAAKAHSLELAARSLATLPLAMLALPTPFLKEPFMPNGPVWSLFWEVLANVVFALAASALTTRRLVHIVLVSAGAVVATVIIHQGYGDLGFKWPTMALGVVRIGFPFTMGIVIHRLFQAGKLEWVPAWPFWALAAVLAAALVMPNSNNFTLEACFLIAAILLLMPAIIASGAASLLNAFWTPIARISGELSYPIYILHMPIYTLLDHSKFYGSLPESLRLAVALGLILGISMCASRLYDQPIRQALTTFFRRYKPATT